MQNVVSTGPKQKVLHFTVDAALLRELGERLIGQPQIALAELVKNSYDADAATCRIVFGDDRIEIIDDGQGMTLDEFEHFWMRIGSTHKVDARRSRELGRPLTGSKGVGRLAVQFLARKMKLETTSEQKPSMLLTADVDWSSIESGRELTQVAVPYTEEPTGSVNISPTPFPNDSLSGTRIVLTGLRDSWDETKLQALGREIWMLRSPFRRRNSRPSTRGPEDFDVEVEAPFIHNAKAALDKILDSLFMNWKARIRGNLDSGRRTGEATVSLEFKAGYPAGQPEERFQERIQLPINPSSESETTSLIDRAEFEILIFRLEQRQSGGILLDDLRAYLEGFGNVSIYDAGFRLPYYGAQQDWLEINADHGRRISKSELLPSKLGIDQRYMLDLPEGRRIFGVVELSTSHERNIASIVDAAPSELLQLSPGRDRLHDNLAHRQLRDFVRYSLDFYANRYAARNARGMDSRRDSEPASTKQERALEILDENEESIPPRVFKDVRREVREALDVSRTEEDELDRRAALLAPLASAGMVALALNHELARERRLLERSVSTLRRISDDHQIPELHAVTEEFRDASKRLSAIQELFGPLLSDSDIEAKDRLRVRPIAEQVVGALRPLMAGLNFDFTNIPQDLRFPLGSLAEWSALLQNLVTNAWNATLSVDHAQVSFEGGNRGNRQWLGVSDNGSGLGVQIENASTLFDPFERRLELGSDVTSIAIGGQGLGLTIVRMIARRRNAAVAFVKPRDGFSTTFELTWKG
jgi:hypothetical protein